MFPLAIEPKDVVLAPQAMRLLFRALLHGGMRGIVTIYPSGNFPGKITLLWTATGERPFGSVFAPEDLDSLNIAATAQTFIEAWRARFST